MEQRQHAQIGVGLLGIRAEEVCGEERVRAHLPVSRLCTLGLSRGAGSVENHGGVVSIDIGRLVLRELLNHGLSHRLDAVDRGQLGRVCGDDEEALTATNLREAGVDRRPDREVRGALEGEVGLRAGVLEVVRDFASLVTGPVGMKPRAMPQAFALG